MPKRDDTVEIDSLPSLQASKSEDAHEPESILLDDVEEVEELSVEGEAPQDADISMNDTAILDPLTAGDDSSAHSQATKSPANGSSKILLLALAALAILLVTAFVFIVQQSNSLENADVRISELENRLSSTDESVSQSSVALQVKVKELKDRTKELEKQMDKLWASAWRRNQTEITNHRKSIEKHDKSLIDAAAGLKELQSTSKRLQKDVAALNKNSNNVKNIRDSLKQQQSSLSKVQKSLKSIQQTQLSIKASTEENSEWIKSINVFRKQTNQALNTLEQKINPPK